MKVATCVPIQQHTREAKIEWLHRTLTEHDADLLLTPQEFFGGHYAMPDDVHVEKAWLLDSLGALAQRHGTALGVGACVKHPTGGATEDYLYFEKDGSFAGYHRKFALPAYDDVRAKGAGALWPEVSFRQRTTPITLRSVGAKMGTIFCWEVFALALVPAYAFAGANLYAHPIKFAPRGWLKLSPREGGKERRIIGFDQDPKSVLWRERLHVLAKHEALAPIFCSTNTWSLGDKYLAFLGMIDPFSDTGSFSEVPSSDNQDHVRINDVNPAFYDAVDSAMHNGGAFKEVAGSADGFYQLKPWTMHVKMRRLEAHLIGGTTRLDCELLANTARQQKKSTMKRAAARTRRPA